MFGLPGILGLIVFLYLRPFDVFKSLRGIPLLQIFLIAAILGILLDLRLGLIKLLPSPLTKMVLLFAGLAIAVTATKGFAIVSPVLGGLFLIVTIYMVIAHGVQTIAGFRVLIGTVLVCLGVLTAVCIHQSTRPLSCVALDPREPNEGPATPDGRLCEKAEDCRSTAQIDADYVCEKVGVFNIFSDGRGRVRYTGTLRDPNELALAISMALPILYFLYEQKRTVRRGLVCALAGAAVFYCVIQTASRGGVLVVGAILVAMSIRLFGWRGVVVAALLASPLALLGGRGGEEAEESSMERLEAAFVGLLLIKAYPLNGAGLGQFGEHHTLTAHNAYILTAAELGFVGGIVWTSMVYLSAKIALTAYQRYKDKPEAITMSRAGYALTTSYAGLAVGVFFLSFAYHYVFWMYLGITSALYGTIKAKDPSFEVSLTRQEVTIIAVVEAIVLSIEYVYVKTKLG